MFQRMMDCTFSNLKAVFAYIDLESALQIGKYTSFTSKHFFKSWPPITLPSIWKSVFLQFQLWILGNMISAAGSIPMAKHTAAIDSCLLPPDIKQLQRFLGMVNFYRCFLPDCAHVLRPLTDLLRGSPKTVQWTAAAEEGFQDAKHLLTKAVSLQHPFPEAKLSLATGASDPHIGGITQHPDDHWCPQGFFSRKLSDMESHYFTWSGVASSLCVHSSFL